MTGIPVQDASGFPGLAAAEFAPASAQELAAILARAAESRTPVTVAGSRTGVTGGCCPEEGWLVSLHRLNSIDIAPGAARVGAGVTLRDLNSAAARTGQFYPPDPTEWTASVGGSIATNASGSRSFRYGATRRHVLAVEVVFADGSLRSFRRGDAIDFDVPAIPLPRATKNTAGYPLSPGMDWIDLVCGSEGTLCVLASAQLALEPRPAELLTGVLFFPRDEQAAAAVDLLRPLAGLRMLEYMDAHSLALLRPRFPQVPPSAAAALLMEQETTPDAGIDLPDLPGLLDDSWIAASDSDRERFRAFRHALPEAVNDLVRRNGFQKLGSDFAVPVEHNVEMLRLYHHVLSSGFGGRYVLFGHIGDAHLHANILPLTESDCARGKEVLLELARRAVAFGGTVSAEHGLGKRKAHLLALQYSPEQIQAMKDVKSRLDPHWLLGRGNLFPYDGR